MSSLLLINRFCCHSYCGSHINIDFFCVDWYIYILHAQIKSNLCDLFLEGYCMERDHIGGWMKLDYMTMLWMSRHWNSTVSPVKPGQVNQLLKPSLALWLINESEECYRVWHITFNMINIHAVQFTGINDKSLCWILVSWTCYYKATWTSS